MTSEQIKLLLEDYKPLEILELVQLEDTQELIEVLSEYISENLDWIEVNLEVNGII